MEIRSATIDDFENLVELNKAIYVNNPSFDDDLNPDFMDTKEGKEYIWESITDPNGICLVAEEDGKLLGYTSGSHKPFPWRKSKYFELINLGIIPEAKGKGLGKTLLDAIEKAAKASGYEKIYLDCYAKNVEALDFYRRNSFVEIDVSLEKKL